MERSQESPPMDASLTVTKYMQCTNCNVMHKGNISTYFHEIIFCMQLFSIIFILLFLSEECDSDKMLEKAWLRVNFTILAHKSVLIWLKVEFLCSHNESSFYSEHPTLKQILHLFWTSEVYHALMGFISTQVWLKIRLKTWIIDDFSKSPKRLIVSGVMCGGDKRRYKIFMWICTRSGEDTSVTSNCNCVQSLWRRRERKNELKKIEIKTEKLPNRLGTAGWQYWFFICQNLTAKKSLGHGTG